MWFSSILFLLSCLGDPCAPFLWFLPYACPWPSPSPPNQISDPRPITCLTSLPPACLCGCSSRFCVVGWSAAPVMLSLHPHFIPQPTPDHPLTLPLVPPTHPGSPLLHSPLFHPLPLPATFLPDGHLWGPRGVPKGGKLGPADIVHQLSSSDM